MAGREIIDGGAGNNFLDGGNGNDVIYSHGGTLPGRIRFGDTVHGGTGDDTIYGTGAGFITGGSGNDTIYGGNLLRSLDGSAGDDIIYAGNSTGATIFGGDGDDTIYGQGARFLLGGLGSDNYEITNTQQMVFETDTFGNEPMFGHDNVYAYVDFTLPENVENLVMIYGSQTYGYGNDEANLIFGNASNNVLEGKGGYDTLTGGAGSDLFVVNPNFGVDVITDFTAGAGTQDAVIFSRSIFSTYEQILAHTRQVGTDTWIEDGAGNTVVLQNVTLGSLHQDDFGFI